MAQRSTHRKKTALCRRVPRGQEAVIQGNNFLSIQPLERTEGPLEGLNSIWQQSDGLRTLALGQRAPEAQVCHDDTDQKTGRTESRGGSERRGNRWSGDWSQRAQRHADVRVHSRAAPCDSEQLRAPRHL